MSIREYRFLLSEQATLEDLIAHIRPESVISRMSLQSRLREVEDELAVHEERSSTQPSEVRLTFRGKPVVGEHGIEADFGPDAVKAFADAVACVGASQHSTLGGRGVVPNQGRYRLIITHTVKGSFGFQMERASQQGVLEPGIDLVDIAVEKVKAIFEASIGTDDELTEALAESDQRAVSAVRKFLQVVGHEDAVCALEFKGSVFAFRDADQIRRSENRLSHDNIREEDVTLEGRFQGFLPKARRAEFRVDWVESDQLSEVVGTVISARVASSIEEPESINQMLNRNVRISAHFRKVGSGNPTYMISELHTVSGS